MITIMLIEGSTVYNVKEIRHRPRIGDTIFDGIKFSIDTTYMFIPYAAILYIKEQAE